MRLTAVWSEVTGEGRLMAGQVKALKRRAAATIPGHVDVLDFLKDAQVDIGRLYDEILRSDGPEGVKKSVRKGGGK